MTVFGPDPIVVEVERVVALLADRDTGGRLESRLVDLEEEPARRQGRDVRPPAREDEEAARSGRGS